MGFGNRAHIKQSINARSNIIFFLIVIHQTPFSIFFPFTFIIQLDCCVKKYKLYICPMRLPIFEMCPTIIRREVQIAVILITYDHHHGRHGVICKGFHYFCNVQENGTKCEVH